MSFRTQIFAAAALAAALAGCGRFGKVNQGRVVGYDSQQGLVTFIQDSNYTDPANPRIDVLRPVTVRVPADPREMGPAPAAGKLLGIDRAARKLIVFDAAYGIIRKIPYTVISEEAGVARDDTRVAGMRFPVIDRSRSTVTSYSPKDRILSTLQLAPQYMELPEDTWKTGDDIRYYYKDPGQALRLMNVTRTDLGKGK
jgi:hypothetical protein